MIENNNIDIKDYVAKLMAFKTYRPVSRIRPILNEIEKIWTKHPDLRLGQLVYNACSFGKNQIDPFFVEDDELIAGMKDLFESTRFKVQPTKKGGETDGEYKASKRNKNKTINKLV